MGDLEWTNDLVIRLMQEYQKRPELWDSTHEMYRVQTLKYETWRELASMFECDIADLRKKLNSLFASHRREKGKIRAGGKSTWFLYPYMSFLPSHLDHDSSDTLTPAPHAQSSITASAVRVRTRAPIREARTARVSDSSERSEGSELGGSLERGSPAPAPGTPEPVIIKQELGQSRAQARARRQGTHKPRLTRPVKRRVLRDSQHTHTHSPLDSRLAEALKLLRRVDLTRKKDECDSFGEYIAVSLRKHDERTQSMIKQAINNILFEQEMKKYSANQYTVLISGIDENPLILSENDATER